MALDQVSYHSLDSDPYELGDGRLLCIAHDSDAEAKKELLGDIITYTLNHDPPLDMRFTDLLVNNISTLPSQYLPESYSNIINNTPVGDVAVEHKHNPNLPNQYWGTVQWRPGSTHRILEVTGDTVWNVPPVSCLWIDHFLRKVPQYSDYAALAPHTFPDISGGDTYAFRVKAFLPYNSIYHLSASWRFRPEYLPLGVTTHPMWADIGYINTIVSPSMPIPVDSILAWHVPYDQTDGFTVSMSTFVRVEANQAVDTWICPVLKSHFNADFWGILGKPPFELVEYRASMCRIA